MHCGLCARRGIVACANANAPHSNGSQFFITLDRCDHLDRKNTIFGKVTGDSIYNAMHLNELEARGICPSFFSRARGLPGFQAGVLHACLALWACSFAVVCLLWCRPCGKRSGHGLARMEGGPCQCRVSAGTQALWRGNPMLWRADVQSWPRRRTRTTGPRTRPSSRRPRFCGTPSRTSCRAARARSARRPQQQPGGFPSLASHPYRTAPCAVSQLLVGQPAAQLGIMHALL